MHKSGDAKRYLLLQINDALFPIGGYSHSYGLETYIQKKVVVDEESAHQYIHNKLRYSFLYSELLAVKLAWEYANRNDMEAIIRLEEIIEASKIPSEVRTASHKLGSRFIKAVENLEIPFETNIFKNYINISKTPYENRIKHHAIVYGVFCASCSIERQDAEETFLYAQTSSMVTNCVKSIPLSQSAGQRLLISCYADFEEIMNILPELEEEMLCLSTPGFDIRCMQHETLYSRIYMS